jgi:transposase-like protein/IS1 family transposase
MTCPNCNSQAKKFGTHRNGLQRFRCTLCGKTFTETHTAPLDAMRIPFAKAELILKLMVEGMAIRSIERLTGVHRDTIMDLLVLAGDRCEKLMEKKISKVPVSDVQADEIWGFVACKEKTKATRYDDGAPMGDAYCFTAIESNTKLMLTWHLGRRTAIDTMAFTEKLDAATSGQFQITTDGFAPYRDAVDICLGKRVDFAQLIKVYRATPEGERRYSPAEVISTEVVPVIGAPDPEKICTSHVERANLSIRMGMRRLTRLTNAFSKKWENLKAAYAVWFAYYNFCRVHQSLRVTPAMEAGLTNHVWQLAELLLHN